MLITTADCPFLFTLHCGERADRHLRRGYLAALETEHRTPYSFNLRGGSDILSLFFVFIDILASFC